MDLTEMDQSILQFAQLANELFDLSKLYFVHIIPDFIAPKSKDLIFHKEFSTDSPIDEAVKSKLEKQIATYFKQEDQDKLAVEVIEGRPYRKLAHWAEAKDTDLLIFGKKKKSTGSGITARRVARQINNHLLLVPEHPVEVIKRILVPMDFSDNSIRALQTALSAKKKFPEAEIRVIHLIRILTSDHYYGLTQTVSYRAEALRAAKDAYKKILLDLDASEEQVPIVYQDDEYGNVFRHLWEYTEGERPDLVIMGAQGHTGMHHFLYGSVTEDFVDYCENIPILVVR
jgi:nucleotide-binding universal stress UspA family protein